MAAQPNAQIMFHPDIPERFRSEVTVSVGTLEWLIPGWCVELNIHFADSAPNDPEASSICAAVKVDKTYRWASLWLYNRWLSGPPFERYYNLVHEFVHLSQTDPFDFCTDTLTMLLDSDGGKGPRSEIIKKVLSDKEESSVQDLAFAIARKTWPEVEHIFTPSE